MNRFLINRPIAVLVTFFGLFLCGVVIWLKLPISLMPRLAIPEIAVQISAGSLSSRDVEARYASPVRAHLQQLQNIEQIESRASEGEASVRLVFRHGTNMALAFLEVNEKIDQVLNLLPKDAVRPIVQKREVGNIPVFNLGISFRGSPERAGELSELCREVIKKRIEQLPQVSMVDMTGGVGQEVELKPRLGYLNSLGLDNSLFLKAMGNSKVSLGNISVKEGAYRYYLNINVPSADLSDLKNTSLRIGGRIFRLEDLAEITLGTSSGRGAYLMGGRRAIGLNIIKQDAARMSDLQDSFEVLLAHLKKDYPLLEFTVTQDQTALLNLSINNLKQDLLLGGILALGCMFIFIREIRTAAIICITIPVALTLSQLGFYFAGLSINIVSLGGLILGMGMIIDNSIVVIESIGHYEKNGNSVRLSSVLGTADVFRPLIASLLTNCGVFLPLILVGGLAGEVFYEEAMSIIIVLVSSVLVSVLLLPSLYALFYRNARSLNDLRPGMSGSFSGIFRIYERGLDWTFANQKKVLFIVAAFLVLGGGAYWQIRKTRLPPVSNLDFAVFINWNEQIDVKENTSRIKALLEHFAKRIEVSDAWIGEQQYLLSGSGVIGAAQARMYIRCRRPEDVSELQSVFSKHCHERFGRAEVGFSLPNNAFYAIFDNGEPDLCLKISLSGSKGLPALETVSAFRDSIRKRLPEATIAPVIEIEKVVLKVNVLNASLYKISVTDISTALKGRLKPEFLDYYEGTESLVPIVAVNAEVNSLGELLNETVVLGAEGQKVPVSRLVDVYRFIDYKELVSGSRGGYYPLNITSEHAQRDIGKIEQVVEIFGKALHVDFSGSYYDNRNLIGELSVLLLVSILLLYFILAAQFESLVQPLFILAELPIAVAGGIVFLFIGGNTVNLMSMIGLVVMSGLVINDSILKIDAINQFRRKGMPLIDSIKAGGHKRLRPIVMISLINIGALLPTVFMTDIGSELQKPLSLSLLGGMMSGLIASLFFVPLVYYRVYDRLEKKKAGKNSY